MTGARHGRSWRPKPSACELSQRTPRHCIMELWIERNLPALFVGAGLGAIIGHQLNSAPFVWLIGSMIGIAIAIPVWAYINRDKLRSDD